MKKYKVCVYAICKNEAQFVEKWVKSMSEADAIYVLDTGSTDDTVKKLQELGVNVLEEVITPWRFDVARNTSLNMVPDDTDICVCTDLDEVFEEGWRKKFEAAWAKGADKLKYNYNWSFDEYDKPATTFYISKVHKKKGYFWHHPVHEVLNIIPGEKEIIVPDVTLNHYPDLKKSRSSYLPLLELSVKEDPEDDRNRHYLGREYMYYHRYNEAIDTLIKHLALPSAIWKPERCASMRFIARSYLGLNRPKEAEMWFKEALNEEPTLRESYVELASLYINQAKYQEAYKLLQEAFLITTKAPIYINEAFAWNDYIYELMGIASYNLGLLPEALLNMNKALELNQNSTEIKNNIEIINKELNK